MVVTEKYYIDQLPMIPLIEYTMMVGVVKTVGVVKCPDIHFQKLGNYDYQVYTELSLFNIQYSFDREHLRRSKNDNFCYRIHNSFVF